MSKDRKTLEWILARKGAAPSRLVRAKTRERLSLAGFIDDDGDMVRVTENGRRYAQAWSRSSA